MMKLICLPPLLLLTALTLQSAILRAQPSGDTLVIRSGGEYPLYRHLYIHPTSTLLDPEKVYDSIPPTQFKLLAPERSFNNTTSLIPYYWLMATVKNDLSRDEEFYYWLNSPGLSKVTAFMRTDSGRFANQGVSGFYVKPSDRQVPGWDVQFKFLIREHATAVILLRVDNTLARNAFFVPQLSDEDVFRQKQERYIAVMGIIMGILLIGFILNLFFGFSLNEPIHFLYATYLAALTCEIMFLDGIIHYLSNTSNRRLLDNLTHLFPGICSFLMVRIMQWFLQQKRTNSYLRLPVDIVIYLLLTVSGIFFFNYFVPLPVPFLNVLQATQALLTGLQLLLVVASAIEKTFQRYSLAWLYLLATIWLLVGLFEYILGFLGVNDVTLIKVRHPNDLQIGLVLEAVVVFIAIIYRYNIYKKEKERLLKELSDHQQELIHRIVRAEQDERRRIATDLHDDVGATLITLNLHISNPPDKASKAEVLIEHHARSLFLAQKAASDIRAVAHNLLPGDLEANGLFACLRERIADLTVRGSTRIRLVLEGSKDRLDEMTTVIVYRIINELLANITRHSMASEAAVQILVEDQGLQILVEDDGIGFDTRAERKGIGLRNIRDRVAYLKGTLHIDSSQHGTNIVVHLPLRVTYGKD